MYVFRFYPDGMFGKNKMIIIDDKLPLSKCSSKLKLVSEMWVPLLEKAYAKYLGSYDAMMQIHANSVTLSMKYQMLYLFIQALIVMFLVYYSIIFILVH